MLYAKATFTLAPGDKHGSPLEILFESLVSGEESLDTEHHGVHELSLFHLSLFLGLVPDDNFSIEGGLNAEISIKFVFLDIKSTDLII